MTRKLMHRGKAYENHEDSFIRLGAERAHIYVSAKLCQLAAIEGWVMVWWDDAENQIILEPLGNWRQPHAHKFTPMNSGGVICCRQLFEEMDRDDLDGARIEAHVVNGEIVATVPGHVVPEDARVATSRSWYPE